MSSSSSNNNNSNNNSERSLSSFHHNNNNNNNITTLYTSVVEDYRVSYVQLASNVHKAIRDGEYNHLPDLLVNNQNIILWESIQSTGWTAVHFATSHFLPYEWFQWILIRASNAATPTSAVNNNNNNNKYNNYYYYNNNYNPFIHSKTALGETVFDIFFRSHLQPLPWQTLAVKNRSRLLLEAIQIVINNDILINSVRDILNNYNSSSSSSSSGGGSLNQTTTTTEGLQRRQQTMMIDFDSFDNNELLQLTSSSNEQQQQQEEEKHSVAVRRVVRFFIHLRLLCNAAFFNCNYDNSNNSNNNNNNNKSFPYMTCLAQTGICPSIITNLLYKLYPHSIIETTTTTTTTTTPMTQQQQQYYPLHLWCQSKCIIHTYCNNYYYYYNNNNNNIIQNGLPGVLVNELTIKTPDPYTRRLPLVEALIQGKSWNDVQTLFTADTTVLSELENGLPIFAAIATATNNMHDYYDDNNNNKYYDENDIIVTIMARRNVVGEKGLISLWNLADIKTRQNAIQYAKHIYTCQQLTNIYQILLACPEALTDRI